MAMKKLLNDQGGAVGIGTLIIFIAFVLVAAVAAAVLINTSGILQQKAMQTGKETIAEVSSNIKIDTIIGERNDTTVDDLNQLEITISTNAGSGKIDLKQMIIRLDNGNKSIDMLRFHNGTADAEYYNITELRDVDGSFTPETPVINSGDLVMILINLDALDIDFPSRTTLHLELIPEFGSQVSLELLTPPSYGVDKIIHLYP
jgi:flagellin FlaB